MLTQEALALLSPAERARYLAIVENIPVGSTVINMGKTDTPMGRTQDFGVYNKPNDKRFVVTNVGGYTDKVDKWHIDEVVLYQPNPR